MEENQAIDYEENLKIAMQKLKECQTSKQLDTCMKCEMLIDCEIRDKFVQATYSRMNKGSEGGFEF